MFRRPPKRGRGRQPRPYDVFFCFWCALLLRFNLAENRFHCECGWQEK